MLSKRNFGMMMTIILVILILFLSSAVLREYFNDYNENHSADSEWVKRSEETKETKDSKNSEKTGISFISENRIQDIMSPFRSGVRIEKQNLKNILKQKSIKKAEAYEKKIRIF